MIKQLAEYEKLAHEVIATEEGLQAALFGGHPFGEVVLGYVGLEPVGFALFFHTFSTFRGAPGIYLEDLFVEPPWRGRGFGRRLLAHLAAIAVARGCHRLEWSVLDWNTPAIGFYRRIGARPMDDWTMYRLTGAALQKLADAV
ncbi:MAG: N-acetyltransferase [Blastocatellia bacterium]|nr:MAG: N-acetyltransferase [Blastocatellia bacterium]